MPILIKKSKFITFEVNPSGMILLLVKLLGIQNFGAIFTAMMTDEWSY